MFISYSNSTQFGANPSTVRLMQATVYLPMHLTTKKRFLHACGNRTLARLSGQALHRIIKLHMFVFHVSHRMNRVLDKEKKQAYDDRHWTHKDLEEMTERDWRIFKEDFGISCKGKAI